MFSEPVTIILMVAAALVLGQSRISAPLKWAETLYHEMSHGLVAILTGGQVVKLNLNWNGSGSCTTRGGWSFFILLAGYAGASLWGAGLFLIGYNLGTIGTAFWLKVELALIVFTLLFWARNLSTIIILGIIGGVYAAALLVPPSYGLPYVLQFMGIFVMLNAIRAPLHLIDGQHVGDGAELHNITRIVPEIVWVLLWFVFALMALGWCLLPVFGVARQMMWAWAI